MCKGQIVLREEVSTDFGSRGLLKCKAYPPLALIYMEIPRFEICITRAEDGCLDGCTVPIIALILS